MKVKENYYTDSLSTIKASGAILVDGKHIADTIQCKHCGGHFVHQRGKAATRGWCFKCNGMLCGQKRCMKSCIPTEVELSTMEKGRYIYKNNLILPRDILF